MLEKKLISFIVPVYNEEKNIGKIYGQLCSLLKKATYEYEIIFVNDGSTDSSALELEKLSVDRRVRVIEFTRNFGKEIAITAGINNCLGNACLIIDADLQHPIEKIPEFVSKWLDGAEVVVGIRGKNDGEGLLKRLGSIIFYKILSRIAELEVTPSSTDFRLLDRSVIDAFNKFSERNRMTRALIDWLGFRRDYVYFEANARAAGKASYDLIKLTKLAFNSFVSLSLFPLKFAGYLGLLITFLSSIIGLFIFIEHYILSDPLKMNFSGPAILAVINIFLVGIILTCLGLIALYIANIHGEVIGRPIYVIRQKVRSGSRMKNLKEEEPVYVKQ